MMSTGNFEVWQLPAVIGGNGGKRIVCIGAIAV
jgi:hypothetical protein